MLQKNAFIGIKSLSGANCVDATCNGVLQHIDGENYVYDSSYQDQKVEPRHDVHSTKENPTHATRMIPILVRVWFAKLMLVDLIVGNS